MVEKRRLVWFIIPALIVAATIAAYQFMTRPAQARSYAGTGQVMQGDFLLDFSVSPAVAKPGDTVQLAVRLTNRGSADASPAISLELPASLRPKMNAVPTGATLNVQNNALSWLPLVQANGGVVQFEVPLRVETADINNPEQAITAVLTTANQLTHAQAIMWVGIPPQVNTVLNITHIAAGQTVRLVPNVSGPGPFTQVWHLGDGRQIAVNDPEVVFPSPGVYDVTLEVGNPLARVSRTEKLTVVPHPAAQFTIDDDTPGLGQTVHFTNQSGGDGPMTYLWHFGDGTTSEERSPTHEYTTPGLFQVQLTVSNEFGTSQAFWAVSVGAPPSIEMFFAESTVTGQLVIGQSATDDSTQAILWDMGDGRFHATPKINHIYRHPGAYYVTVTATNRYGSTQTGQWVQVEPGQWNMYLPLVPRAPSVTQLSADELPELVLEDVALEDIFVMEPLTFEAGTTTVEALYLYINEARRQFDLPPLAYNYELTVAAQLHAEDMASYNYTAHAGSDGSRPQDRFAWANYPHAYAGEATAWGFEDPRRAVEFWINSPPHRPIILNRYANQVGVGQGINYNATSVWYWTAEFGNSFGAATPHSLRVRGPQANQSALNTETVTYSWNWTAQLAPAQRFAVYLYVDGQAVELGSVNQPWHNLHYRLDTTAVEATLEGGVYEWQVVLLQGNSIIVQSERYPITIQADPSLPVPTAEPIATATVVTPLATPTPIPTITPTPEAVDDTPPPATRVVIPTATPLPEQ